MPGLYRDEGIVLRTIKLGEADRIIIFFTAETGKVRAVAKGVRKSGSRFGSRLDPGSHLSLQCYRGRDLDVVTQVETIDAFRRVREDYDSLVHAAAMFEVVDQFSLDREPNPSLFRMLLGALKTLNATPSPVIAPAFFWKVLALEGFAPLLDSCVRCGKSGEEFVALDVAEGGVLCLECGALGGRRISSEGLSLLALLLGGGLHLVMAAPPEPSVIAEIETLGVHAIEYHLERRMRSAALL